jgi:hypothetical protein
VGRRQQGRGWNGHFLGFWARLNCENMPVIPAWLVRRCLEDPRRIPYLLVWKDERHDGEIKDAVRLARYVDPHNSSAERNHVELKRTDGSATVLRIAWRMLQRNGGPCCWSAHTATPRVVMFTDGNGIVLQAGQTESGKSVGDAGLVPGCATLPKAVICVQRVSGGLSDSASCFALTETCHGRSRGFLTSLRPSMIPASTRYCAGVALKRENRDSPRHRQN